MIMKQQKEPQIVVIGGGTGISTMLRGLKKYTSQITAIVTVADNGGGSGILREEMKMLPPGDIRNCILALANTEPIMEKLFQYRFTEGSLKGQNFGNLFLAAMNGVCGSFEQAVKSTSEVLAVTGRVLPVTNEDIQLCAEFIDGTTICGEWEIVQASKVYRKSIQRVYLEPDHPKALAEVIQAIEQAQIIILGPGSLYTSIIPNLLVDGVAEALQNSKGMRIYISNIMTQPGETEGYDLKRHIQALEEHGISNVIQYVIANNKKIPEEILQVYEEDGAIPVKYEKEEFVKNNIHLIEAPVCKVYKENKLIRHDPDCLAYHIMELAKEYQNVFFV
ncbi:MAG: YvcK family protein [Epulopiscium sp.]|nr:YvcK family protein [Candidatus Epulonipiscium sp.]